MHFNIRSIRKNFDQLLVFLQAYDLLFCDIVILSECWQTNDDLYNIEGYNRYYNHADYNQNDGVVVFVRDSFDFIVREFKHTSSGVTFSKVELIVNNLNYGITCVYRPPATNVQLFLEDLEQYLSGNLDKQVEVLVGDINIDLKSIEDNNVNTYQFILNSYGFVSTINGPTRVTSSGGSHIDHIFLRKNMIDSLGYSTYIINSDLTDHFPIMLNFFGKMENNSVGNSSNVSTRTISRVNLETFEEFLKKQDWSSVTTVNNVEKATENFSNIINELTTRSREDKIVTFRLFKKIKPWITHGIVTSIKHRDKMKKKTSKEFHC